MLAAFVCRITIGATRNVNDVLNKIAEVKDNLKPEKKLPSKELKVPYCERSLCTQGSLSCIIGVPELCCSGH